MAWDDLTPEQVKEASEYNRKKRIKESKEELERLKSMSKEEKFIYMVEQTLVEHWENFRLPFPMRSFSSRFNRTAQRFFGDWNTFILNLKSRIGAIILVCPPNNKRFIMLDFQLEEYGLAEGTSSYEKYLKMLGSPKPDIDINDDMSLDAFALSYNAQSKTSFD